MSKREPQDRKERLTIYRVRGDKVAHALIIKTDKAKPPVQLKIAHGDATLFVKNTPPPRLPPWTSFLLDNQETPPGLFGGNRSEGAALVIRDLGDTFILSFGMGFHLVNLDLVERDFGLRVTLNSVDPDRLRSLDKASFEDHWLNTRNQSPREADIFDLQIDYELDMVNAITGATDVAVFGGVVTGRDALSISTAASLDDLRAIFEEAQARHASPLPERFSWMDNVSRVKDKDIIGVLDVLLEELLNTDPDSPDVWMGEPEIVDWERQAGYSFERGQRAARHPTLQLSDLLAHMRDKKTPISVNGLKTHLVHSNDANGECIKTWSAFRCLYAEIADKGETHVLRDGVWHTVNKSFQEKIDAALAKIEIDADKLPVYNHGNEGDYNAAVRASDENIELMDKQNVAVGGPHDKIEFCDLVRGGRDLIHVKYYRSSATLSHLFAQGGVSGETFIKDEEFRRKLNGKLPAKLRLNDPAAKPNASDYRVVYAIATTKRLPVELPFFSKITLKNAVMTLQALNFNVALARIDVDPDLLKMKSFKAQAPRQARRAVAPA
jgi:uncharacterized protein (TIGR04141 family)